MAEDIPLPTTLIPALRAPKYLYAPTSTATTNNPRVSMLLWGSSGCGKTILATTAPAKRLIILFDPDGDASIDKNDDNLVMDLSKQPPSIVNEAKDVSNPFDLNNILKNDESIRTIIIDSVTAFAQQAVAYSAGHSQAKGATFENPAMQGYGFRNRFTLGLAKNLLTITGKYNRNIIFICHEDTPKLNDKGEIQSITILLGGSLPEEVPLQISEVWNMRDMGTKRSCIVRTVGYRKPMKSRMFDTTKKFEFDSTYDAVQKTGLTLEHLFTKWKENKYNKIAVP